MLKQYQELEYRRQYLTSRLQEECITPEQLRRLQEELEEVKRDLYLIDYIWFYEI